MVCLVRKRGIFGNKQRPQLNLVTLSDSSDENTATLQSVSMINLSVAHPQAPSYQYQLQ